MPNQKKVTDAELMTGFNPAFGVTAEEIEAQQEDAAAVEGAAPEGEPTEQADDDSAGAPTAPAPADLVEVKLDGRTVKAPKDIADAFTREINRRDGTRGAELQQLRERLAYLEGRAATPTAGEPEKTEPEPVPPDPELMIENPAEYQKQVLAFVEASQERRAAALARQYEEAEASKARETERVRTWNSHVERFYSDPENAVLRENRDIVDLVLEQNREALAPLSVEEGFKELGRLAKAKLAKLTGTAPEVRARKTPTPPVLEGGSRRVAAAPPASDEGPRSLSQAIRDRRRAAAEAFAKGSARQAQAR
jgi:hypothetical protein